MLVIGNGESRRSIDIAQIRDHKIGCNAILRDFRVDHLVCVDRKMVKEAVETNYTKSSLVYTRHDWIREFKRFPGVRELPFLPYTGTERWDEAFHWGSGPYAVLLGAQLTTTDTVNLLGFDLYGIDRKLNNIYKDTNNYKESYSRSVDPRYWIYQIGKIFELYPNVKFTVYQKEGWAMPDQWNKNNVSVDKLDCLL